MNKKMVSIIIGLSMVGALGATFWIINQNKETKPQEIPTELKASKSTKNKESSEEIQESTTETSSTEQKEQTEPTADVSSVDYQIINNLEVIKDEIAKLHDFSNGTTEYWNSVRNNLKEKYGIVVSDNTKGGFGIYDVSAGQQSNVLSAVSMSVEYEKVTDKQVKFRVVTRTGRAGVVDNDIDYTAKEVRKAIKKDGSDVTVDYQLNIGDDGKTGELVWLAGNWW